MGIGRQTNWWAVATIGLALVSATTLILYVMKTASDFWAILLLLVVWLLSLAKYLLPTIIAVKRRLHQVAPIIAINLLAGWTFIGWVVAFAWSVSAVKRNERRR